MRTVLLTVLLAVPLALFGCAGGSGSAGTGGESADRPSGDAYWAAFAKADEAIKAKADDAVLVSAGSQDASLTSVPKVWAFVYLSPSTKHAWRISIEGGKALQPVDIGASPVNLDLKSALKKEDVKISAVEAIDLARTKAKSKSTTAIPPNVVVGGIFVKVEGGGATMMQQGVWNVTFTDNAGATALQYNVSMLDGTVTPAGQ